MDCEFIKIDLFLGMSQVEDETETPINFIRVTNYASHGQTAYAEIIFGGPQSSYVGMLFRSRLNTGVNSRIEIYERHV